MRSIAMLSGVLACLLGCAAQHASGETRDMRRVDFVCANDEPVEMRFFPAQGLAVLVRKGKSVELRQQPVASGFLYSSESVSVRGKGSEIMLDDWTTTPLRCQGK